MEARFLTDTSLEWLARRLRILGYDIRVMKGARLEQLFESACSDGRVVLTLSSRVPRRELSITRIVVNRADVSSTLRSIADSFEAGAMPFMRCPTCNGLLELYPLEHPPRPLPPGVPRDVRSLRSCTECGKWYWHGSHVDRLRAWFEHAIGRRLDAPQSPATP
jgi:uncharacterized protein with PIN domain